MGKLTRKQPPNRRVLLAALPCVAGGVYFFGWRSLAMVLAACAVGFAAEWAFCRRRKEPVSEAIFVTAFLFALILPPTAGWHVLVVGMLVATVVAKEIFGGFGRNIFNPAMVGRCFVYVCFPVAMTGVWAPNAFEISGSRWYGALDRWTTQNPSAAPGEAPDAYTGATPLGVLKEMQLDVARLEGSPEPQAQEELAEARKAVEGRRPGPLELLLGTLGGTMGVTSAGLILIGGLYLVLTGTANRTIILSVILSCAVLSEALYRFGARPSSDALRALLSGGFLFGAFFMATDPVSSAKTFWGRIIYGCIIGAGRVIIQNFSVFNGGFMFALLLANTFAPAIDHLVLQGRGGPSKRPSEPAAGAAGAAGGGSAG